MFQKSKSSAGNNPLCEDIEMGHELTADAWLERLQEVWIQPLRLMLQLTGEPTDVSELRGVWGLELHDHHPSVYQAVFRREADATGRTPPQGYVLSLPLDEASVNRATSQPPAVEQRQPPGSSVMALDVTWIGEATAHATVLLDAWRAAGQRGLGARRDPFTVLHVSSRSPVELASQGMQAWSLSELHWPVIAGPSARCRLRFVSPLRLMREDKLISKPTFADLIRAVLIRLQPFLSADTQREIATVRAACLELAAATDSSAWQGESYSHTRYSGRQRAEVMRQGVCGTLELPTGPGPLWPLLAAAHWLHLGKATTEGFGRMEIGP